MSCRERIVFYFFTFHKTKVKISQHSRLTQISLTSNTGSVFKRLQQPNRRRSKRLVKLNLLSNSKMKCLKRKAFDACVIRGLTY